MSRSGRIGTLIAIGVLGFGGVALLFVAKQYLRRSAQTAAASSRPPPPPEPRTAPEWYARGNDLLANAKDYRGAADAYGRAAELSPQMGEAHYGRGCALLELGDVDGALSELESALSLAPEGARWKEDAQNTFIRAQLRKGPSAPR